MLLASWILATALSVRESVLVAVNSARSSIELRSSGDEPSSSVHRYLEKQLCPRIPRLAVLSGRCRCRRKVASTGSGERELLLHPTINEDAVDTVFEVLGLSKIDVLFPKELALFLALTLDEPLADNVVDEMVRQYDTDGDGGLKYDELKAALAG